MSYVEKIQEQCLESVLGVLPARQLPFILLTTAIFGLILDGTAMTVIDAFEKLSFEQIFSLDKGLIWRVPVAVWLVATVLGILNSILVQRLIRFSLKSLKLQDLFSGWQETALGVTAHLNADQRAAVSSSLKDELSGRTKTYQTLRFYMELTFSVCAMIVYGAVLVIWQAKSLGVGLKPSWIDIGTFVMVGFVCWRLHVASISFAISSLLPLRVYQCSATGEILFFEGKAPGSH
ncbi:hypothetical protein [Achromobacter ruhlandii]|uniref:hypothetical protein n=1 Tax=Achromobacter ruhlandii TaxID=72557 RepID=UPI001EEE8318|nr:hypothetical protein [Achromobacter ruhlandii]MCZ8396215.1 hypothetical protein [Achromobacter ruhlandii]